VFFGTQFRGAKIAPAGAFRADEPARHFDVVVSHVHGNPIFMKVDHAASSPDKVEYCTLVVEHLRVAPTGRMHSPQEARALRSKDDPFSAAPVSRNARRSGAPAVTFPATSVSWTRRSSPYQMDITPLPDGTSVFSGHPTRAGEQPETVIEFGPTALVRVRISGLVRFYTSQCKGAQIVAGTAYGNGSSAIPIGVFTPTSNGSRFDTVVEHTAGKTVYLNFKGNPKSPQDIDYCTLRVEELRVRPG
jgi:hypothetical protein